MITDLIQRQNPRLIGFLRRYQNKVHLLEKTSKKEPANYDCIDRKIISGWTPFYLKMDSKIRRHTVTYLGGKTTIAHKIYAKRKRKKSPIRIPHMGTRGRRLKLSTKEGGFKKYSSLFL